MTKNQIKARITQIYENTGKFPKIGDLAMVLKLPEYRVSHLFKILENDGFLVRVGNWYRLPSMLSPELTKADPPVIPPAPVLEEVPPEMPLGWIPRNTLGGLDPEPQRPSIFPELPYQPEDIGGSRLIAQINARAREIAQPKKDPLVISIIRWAFLVMGVAAVFLSSWYTASWFMEFLPPFAAWISGLIYVCFSVLAFELAILLFKKKGAGYLLGGTGIMVLWLIVILFSIFSTITGQYNQWVNRQAAQIVVPQEESRKLELDQIGLKRAELKNDQTQTQTLKASSIALLNAVKSSLESEKINGRAYNNEFDNIEKYTRDLRALQKSLDELDSRELALTGKAPTVEGKGDLPDVYSWISAGTPGLKREQVQFWANVLPATFLDIIAPVGFTVFFFMGGRRKDE